MIRLELLKVKADLERELEDFVLNCSKCGLDVHWVSGLGVLPGHSAHREPAPHGEPGPNRHWIAHSSGPQLCGLTTSHSRPPPRATPTPPICARWRTIHRCSGGWSHARTTDRMLPPVPIVSPAQVAPPEGGLAMEQITSLGHLFGVPLRAAHYPGIRPDRPPI